MIEILAPYYLWLKAFHLIFVICWMVGLLYLPRLFAYHAQLISISDLQYEVFLTMERKLLYYIMTPAFFLAMLFGSGLFFLTILKQTKVYWFHLKILLVFFLIFGHLSMVKWYFEFKHKNSRRSPIFFRVINEIPALLMVVIIILAVVKPF